MYAIRLEASPLAQGLLVALPGLVLGLSTLLAQWWRGRYVTSVGAVSLPGIGLPAGVHAAVVHAVFPG
ncbi:MAG: hypothetical protein HND48_19785 [Chloroflexi bacterium]|nr:hypothetical protein [Chloroflexota bacterium]